MHASKHTHTHTCKCTSFSGYTRMYATIACIHRMYWVLKHKYTWIKRNDKVEYTCIILMPPEGVVSSFTSIFFYILFFIFLHLIHFLPFIVFTLICFIVNAFKATAKWNYKTFSKLREEILMQFFRTIVKKKNIFG